MREFNFFGLSIISSAPEVSLSLSLLLSSLLFPPPLRFYLVPYSPLDSSLWLASLSSRVCFFFRSVRAVPRRAAPAREPRPGSLTRARINLKNNLSPRLLPSFVHSRSTVNFEFSKSPLPLEFPPRVFQPRAPLQTGKGGNYVLPS